MGQIIDGMANSVDPDQTAPKEQSDLGLGCFAQAIVCEHFFRIIAVQSQTISFDNVIV